VSTGLEEVENDQCALDVGIARNRNVLQHFLTLGPQPWCPSPIVQLEITTIYGANGPLMLELLLLKPDIVLPKILSRLRERAQFLAVQKLKNQSKWALRIERLLPQQLAKYQPMPGPREDIPDFAIIGLYPVVYRVDQTYIVTEFAETIVDLAWQFQNPVAASLHSLIDQAKEYAADLRSNRVFNTTHHHAITLCLCATLVSRLDTYTTIGSRIGPSLVIPLEIGLTDSRMHGYRRLLRIAAESIITRKWTEGVTEIAGLLPTLDVPQAAVLMRMFDFTCKCMLGIVPLASDAPSLVVTIRSGNLAITYPDQARSFSVDLSFYSHW
jgi:hypothetical protein